MRERTTLITGGAGFIGSHLSDELLAHGYRVRALDNLDPQVHPGSGRPSYLSSRVELFEGDVRDRDVLEEALDGVDSVVHLAAAVGVGQSMYEIERYTSVNSLGTATLLEALLDRPSISLVVASSMSIYGEGLYRAPSGEIVEDAERRTGDLERGEWELLGEDRAPLTPIPTPETKRPAISSIYALTKYDQERMCLVWGRAYQRPVVALRFFNVYGPRQALSNPYTGVLAIFASRYLNDRSPVVYEDGRQMRDFVCVHDVARACRLALESERAAGGVYNIGSGSPASVGEIADRLRRVLGKESIAPKISGRYRAGDVRHCFADIERARRDLGYEPQVGLEEGMRELAKWLRGESAIDRTEAANLELVKRGLAR
ncbi:MAG TPA: NAD-dependent epimerase/dehydratase family protein [Planctomycetota bacterium]|nr:NAD-dependent epimerase/dehydratase family protein [Planctomycetota bacterium]